MPVQHDQFYTKPGIAKQCVDMLRKYVGDGVWIEPSAGTGSFLEHMPTATAYDIDPKAPNILQLDFLTATLPEKCIVFGNPPFGRQASLAKKFIRHAAIAASIIAFILPLSFTKPSMQNAFPKHFHLEESWILPKDSFIADGKSYNVPCVFQIWIRKDTPRMTVEKTRPSGFMFVKHSEQHDFVFRRVGGNAGKCSLPHESHNPQCHYYIKLDDSTRVEKILEASKTYPFPTNTTGPRSLSKDEATQFIHQTF